MILGYNKPRPTADDYVKFEKKLTKGISDLKVDGISLLIYGSYVRGDHVPGRSDIDAVLIFPDEFVINKDNLANAADLLEYALTGSYIPFQTTVTDIASMRDGRFNTYDQSFIPYFQTEARITGTNYIPEMVCRLPTMVEQTPVRFNLRKARNALLFSQYHAHNDHEALITGFNKILDSASRASKQVLHFSDGNLRKHRFAAVDEIGTVFPEVDSSVLPKIKDLYTNLSKLDRIYHSPAEMMEMQEQAVTFMESLVKAYVARNPIAQ